MAFPRWLIPAILILLVLIPSPAPASAQAGDGQFFPGTGHLVSREFLELYQQAVDPAVVYGSPITEAYLDPLTGYTLQYFERARLELHPSAPTGERVEISPLGWLVYEPGQPAKTPASGSAACRSFAQADVSVCHSFLAFFDRYGGLEQFGQPISTLEYQDGLYVQYFEAARFEWHPEAPSGQRVVLTSLGRQYFDQQVNDPALLRPVASGGSDLPVMQLQARAFPARSVLPSDTRQTIFVVVQDQYLRPAVGALPVVTVTFPGSRLETYTLPETDAFGISRLELAVGSLSPDSVISATVQVSLGDLSAKAATWFRIWW